MRLRLTIHRNGLPTTKIMHKLPIPSASASMTVSRLLEDVDAIIPLESQHWGLESYTVETVDGYECLHFEEVGRLLADGDEVW